MSPTTKMPLPGYGLAIIDKSQMEHVEFSGEDSFDTPQSGILIKLRSEDAKQVVSKGIFSEDNLKYADLLNKKIYWRKYADADGTFYDNNLGKDIIFIDLEKIMGVDDAA